MFGVGHSGTPRLETTYQVWCSLNGLMGEDQILLLTKCFCLLDNHKYSFILFFVLLKIKVKKSKCEA